MGKKEAVIFLLAELSMLIIASSASASFILGNKSIELQSHYSPGEIAKGWLNISFQNQPSDSMLSGNFGGGITLSELLEQNNAEYSCIPGNCETDYSSSNPEAEKSFSLGFEQEKILSFSISGIIASLNNFSLNINASGSQSCINPLEIDILDDSSAEWTSWKFSDDFNCSYESGTGCFNDISASEINLSAIPFCEKITLVPSGKFLLGAWVRKNGNPANLKMLLVPLSGGIPLASCNLPEASPSGSEISCIINYSNARLSDYYVCIKSNVSNSYSIKTESDNPCGYFAISSTSQSVSPPAQNQPGADYFIFAKGAKFSNIGSFIFNQKEYEKRNTGDLSSRLTAYLRKRYADSCASCSINCTNGCIIPVKFKSFWQENITLSSALISGLSYSGAFSSGNLYDSAKSSPKINSGFLKLDLASANLSLPRDYGNQTLSISLAGSEIISQRVSIARIPVINSLSPKNLPAGVSALFTANVSSPSNSSIISYLWSFGDGDSETTSKNSVSHSYGSVGMYTLNLKATDSNGFSSNRDFLIIIGSPSEAVNSTLKNYRQRIGNLTSQINSEPDWQRNELKKIISLDSIDSRLTELERKANLAITDEDYSSIMGNLSLLNVPKYIKNGKVSGFPVFIDTESISFEALANYDEDYSKISENQENAKQAILKWQSENLEMTADYYSISAYYDAETAPLFNYYKLKLKALNPEDDELYIIVNSRAVFSPEENSKELGEFSGIKLMKTENKDIEFISPAGENPLEIEIYTAPRFKKLELEAVIGPCNFNKKCEAEKGENSDNCKSDCKPWGRAVFYIILVVILAFAAYIFLQEWYRRKYESHLFKNRNDLYNLINFINTSLSKKILPDEISRNLARAGWSQEQISYVMNRIKGKKTGMPFEIPLFGLDRLGKGNVKNKHLI